MVSERQPSPRRPVKPALLGWLAAFAVVLMIAGAAMAQGEMSKATERLFDAVFKNDITAVKSSIPAGAKLDALNSWGQTPAELAVDLGYFDIAHFLTSLRQFEKREKQETPLSTAGSFLEPQFTPPSAVEPVSPPPPAPAQAPEPTPLPGGAFDPSIASQGSILSVIGDIRGPGDVPTAAPKPAQPPSPARRVAAAQPAAPPAGDESGFISNLWGQLANTFSDEPEVFAEAPGPAASPSAAEPVAAAPVDEELGFISNVLGQLKDAFSTAPLSEDPEEPVVAFSQAKLEPAPAQNDSPVKDSAKAPGPAVAAAEPANIAPGKKPSFTDRLANFLSLDKEPPARFKKRRRSRARTETALIRFPMPTRPSEFLKGVALNLIGAPDLGKPAPANEPCISKNRRKVSFCVVPVAWPEILRPHFKVNTYMYGGAKSIVRYDDGKATFVHVLFPTASFEAVLDHFERRFGPPTDQQERFLASLSSPVRSNPMAAWWSIEGSSVTSLQVRKYDDTRGGFPDMEYGAISLHIQGAKPIFPLLSTANLMLLKFKRPPKRLPKKSPKKSP